MEVEHAPRGFPYSSAKTLLSRRSGEMDFKDVFGGPPRRFSMQEVRGRYVFGETVVEEEEEEEGRVSTPVFGEETMPRRRHPGGNFFDDIFGGDESYVSPRNRDHDRNNLFVSSPKSTSISPTKPRSEQFGTSPVAQFSPPAKSNKIEFPSHGSYKLDSSTNALISPRTPLSRFSSQVIRDEIRTEVRLYRQSTMPREACFKIEDLPTTVTSNEIETSPNSKKERKSFDASSNQFYHSLYKWASGRGIPMMNLIGRNNSKSKDRIGKCASFNGRVENRPSLLRNGGWFVNTEPEHLKMEADKKYSLSTEEEEQQNSVQDVVLDADDISVEAQQCTKSGRKMSRAKSNIKDRILKEVLVQMDESPRSEITPTLRSLLIAEAEQKGTEEIKAKTSRKHQAGPSMSLNLNEETSINEDCNTTFDSQLSPGKTVAKGKVKEFVQIFNQEADTRKKTDDRAQNNSRKWKDQNPSASFHAEKVDENVKDDPEPQPTKIQKTPTPNHNTASSSDSFPWDSTASVENSDKSIDDNFMVEQLSNDIEEATQGYEGLEHIKAIDTKIQQWSMGKSGNIRSLLSTLQYVLWPGSGWRPIPLVELIEVNSVKRAYQKALLRLHPDKLQQNSAASQHKYTAERIFDILQEAWDHFNTFAPWE